MPELPDAELKREAIRVAWEVIWRIEYAAGLPPHRETEIRYDPVRFGGCVMSRTRTITADGWEEGPWGYYDPIEVTTFGDSEPSYVPGRKLDAKYAMYPAALGLT